MLQENLCSTWTTECQEKCQMIPEKIKSVAVRACKYGIPAACKWTGKVYPDHKFAWETVRD